MKSNVLTLFFLAFFSMLAKIVLPKGEKSPFYPPLKFLVSLMLIVTVFSPLFQLGELANTPLPSFDESRIDAEAISQSILQKSAEGMQSAAESAFPATEFSLRVEADEAYVPTAIYVLSKDEAEGRKIALFLQKNYEILSLWKEEEVYESEETVSEF